MKPPSPEQACLFPRTAAETEDRLEALYAVAIHCGLRQGELLALKWEDPNIVQEILGDFTTAITLGTYSHILPGMGDAAGAMDEALG